jgi:hypothetical protein
MKRLIWEYCRGTYVVTSTLSLYPTLAYLTALIALYPTTTYLSTFYYDAPYIRANYFTPATLTNVGWTIAAATAITSPTPTLTGDICGYTRYGVNTAAIFFTAGAGTTCKYQFNIDPGLTPNQSWGFYPLRTAGVNGLGGYTLTQLTNNTVEIQFFANSTFAAFTPGVAYIILFANIQGTGY